MRVGFLLLLLFRLCSAGATFYVDSIAGADEASGISANTAWKTLAKVNEHIFRAGDRVLFKAGDVWQGQLVPRVAEDRFAGPTIVFDRFGPGAKPKIDGLGRVDDVIRLYNVQNIEIHNLEITNHGREPVIRRGVDIFLDNFGTAKHIVISGLYIHDVNGMNGRGNDHKDNGGIIFRTKGNRVPSRFDGLLIERNLIRSVDRSAIAADSYHAMRSHWFPSLHVVIRDNYVDDIGGDGIVPWATDNALIEHNIARNCNRRAGSYNAGIWPWSTDNSLFQMNEASLTRTTRDGEGFDSDYNSRNTLFQYNYSHDNEGGFMLICTPGKGDPKENVGNIGTVIRYNISRNDRTRAFNLSGGEHTLVHNNVIYVGPGMETQMLAVTSWEGWASDALFQNNIFWVLGKTMYGHELKRHDDGTYELGPGWGPARDIVFRGNQYIGEQTSRPPDLEAKVSAAEEPPKLNWSGPAFDASDPEAFNSFMTAHRHWLERLFKQQFGHPLKLGR